MASEKKMASENVFHIKLTYDEAIQAKKEILSSEMSSLKIAKMIGRYRILRMEEMLFKARAYVRMKEARSNIRKVENQLPSAEIPRVLKKHKKEEEKEKEEIYQSKDIESQLQEIQDRLDDLKAE